MLIEERLVRTISEKDKIRCRLMLYIIVCTSMYCVSDMDVQFESRVVVGKISMP